MQGRKLTLCCALTIAQSLFSSVSAETFESADTLETIVVTATRTPKLLKDSPVLTRVISGSDITRCARPDISGLLEQKLPGVEFSLGMAQNPQINFSGFGGGGILFLLDGERMAGETLDNPDYQRLNMQDVERVEIVKGAASSRYGSNATGGVINIISARPKEGSHLTLDARYGSHSTQSYGAVASFRRKKFANTLDARYDSHAEFKFPNPGDFSCDYATYSWNLRDRATLTFSNEASITARASYYRRQRKSAEQSYDRYSDIAAGIAAHWRDFRLNYAFDSYDKYDYEVASHEQIRDYRNRQHTLHLQYSHEFDGVGTITAGGDWLDDYLMSYEFSSSAHRQTNLDAYLQWDWHPCSKVWVVPGLRFDWFSASKARRLSPKLSILWQPGSNMNVRVNYAAGFRAPTLKELYMDFDMAGIFHIYGNPNLKSETSQNFSVSGEYTKGSLNLTASAFHNFVNNRVAYLWNQQLLGQQYLNQHRMNICGIDLSAAKSFNFGLTAHAGYVFTYEKYHKGDLRANPTRPHALTLQADYAHDWSAGWQFAASANFKWMSAVTGDILSMFSTEAARQEHYPAYSLLGMNVSQAIPLYRKFKRRDNTETSGKLSPKLIVAAIIDNLLNYRPEYYFYNSPITTGTTFQVALTLKL